MTAAGSEGSLCFFHEGRHPVGADGRKEISGSVRGIGRGFRERFPVGAEKHAFRKSGKASCGAVARLVSEHDGAAEVDLQRFRRGKNHAGFGLPAVAVDAPGRKRLFRMMRAEANVGDGSARA